MLGERLRRYQNETFGVGTQSLWELGPRLPLEPLGFVEVDLALVPLALPAGDIGQ